MSLNNPATRWAIVSTGKIASDFVSSLKSQPENHQVVAVAARNFENAKEFAKKFDIPNAFQTYQDMAKFKEYDVVYIGTIHTHHYPLIKMYLEEGHNVLSEKPITLHPDHLKEVIGIAKQKNLFLMEGFWSRFFPIYDELRYQIKEGVIGEPRYASASFGFNNYGSVPRLDNLSMGGGCLMDLGCYPIQFVQMIFNHEKPSKITATGFIHPDSKVDLSTTAILEYSNNRVAVINTSLVCALDQKAYVSGSKTEGNHIVMEKVWAPYRMTTPKGLVEKSPPKSVGTFNFEHGEAMIYEANSVRECLLKGLKENPLMTLDMSMQLQEIMQEIREQIGLKYDCDQ